MSNIALEYLIKYFSGPFHFSFSFYLFLAFRFLSFISVFEFILPPFSIVSVWDMLAIGH